MRTSLERRVADLEAAEGGESLLVVVKVLALPAGPIGDAPIALRERGESLEHFRRGLEALNTAPGVNVVRVLAWHLTPDGRNPDGPDMLAPPRH